MGGKFLKDTGDQLAELSHGLLLDVREACMKQLVNGALHQRPGAAVAGGMDHDPTEILVCRSIVHDPPSLLGESESNGPTLTKDGGRADFLETHDSGWGGTVRPGG